MNNIKNDRGISMIAVIGMVLILSIITVGVFTLTGQTMKSSTQRRQKDNALYMAESGVNYLLYELKKKNKSPDQYEFPYTIDSSILAQDYLEPGDSFNVVFNPDSGNTYKAVSTGTSKGSTRVINVIVDYITKSLFPQKYVDLSATSGEEGYYEGYMENTYIDVMVEYLPDDPPSGSTIIHDDPEVKNETLNLVPGTYWYEDSLTIKNNGIMVVNGPATVYINGDFDIEGGTLRIQGNGPIKFVIGSDQGDEDDDDTGNFTVDKSNSLVQINAPVSFHVNKDLKFKNHSRLTNTAQAWFFVKDEFKVENNTTIGSAPASNLIVLLATYSQNNGGDSGGDGHYDGDEHNGHYDGEGHHDGDEHDSDDGHNGGDQRDDHDGHKEEVVLENSASFTGGLYAPTRTVCLENSATVHGAVVGAQFGDGNDDEGEHHEGDSQPWNKITWDPSLLNIMLDSDGIWQVREWTD
ncbi:MAG: type IV pilus modification PilV family protein [Bacillota bacterium]